MSSETDYLECHIMLSASQLDDVEGAFWAVEALAVSNVAADGQAVYEPKPGEILLWDRIKVTAIFAVSVDPLLIMAQLSNYLSAELMTQLTWTRLAHQCWETAWQQHYKPQCFGDLLWVTANSMPVTNLKPDQKILYLEPGLAFGTGSHATTALCLADLVANKPQGLTVLDFGCGSGILAIAALLLGAKKVVAVDIDPQALLATQDNADKNGVADGLVCCHPDQVDTMHFDWVVANILAPTLVELLPTIAQYQTSATRLSLSGILTEQQQQVSQAYSKYYHQFTYTTQQEWLAISAIRL